ncbi:hypothetical protein JAAARDRAFT_42781 [Jaapia argillacea MUCL 33604]|uniref:Uncharacterized protein n=1 Tax=Jaapia argillacea MUCL 33604 TaxID=933084 RepID=A0A067P3R4_9AGAM|nr:hypothetical protein JAAARDRAFT_42781 [Jaapia argillacea MUCL 33604]
MPGPSRTQKAEAKYNVTTEFPHLGLHQAAATGNIGLVKYALSHGQPVNSVLDGVLPLHAACSGGNELVVKLLIENGADVNAPRLPRRYSNDKGRTSSSQPIVGTSGSTPLHFAAANGHTSIVLHLLQHGAHPDRPDKHGVTPEMLAQQNGFTPAAELLRDWKINKDRDLWEREEQVGSSGASVFLGGNEERGRFRERQGSTGTSDGDICIRKKIRMKRSIENALSTIKSTTSLGNSASSSASTSHQASNSTSSSATIGPNALGVEEDVPPSPSIHAHREYTFELAAPSTLDPLDMPRRPSLPYIFDSEPSSRGSRKISTSSSKSGYRRPRSAGNGADQSPSNSRRKLTPKYSLLNIFKKSNGDSPSSSATPADSSPSPSINIPDASPSPSSSSILHPSNSSHLATSPPLLKSHSDNPPSPVDSSPANTGSAQWYRSRLGSEPGYGYGRNRPMPALPQAAELKDAHLRARSGSGASTTANGSDSGHGVSTGTPPSRPGPGILKGHHRSSSSQSQSGNGASGSARSLRFDSASSGVSNSNPSSGGVKTRRTTSPRPLKIRGHGSPSPARRGITLRGCNSVGSFKSGGMDGEYESGEAEPTSAPPMIVEFVNQHDGGICEEEEEYGGGGIVREDEDEDTLQLKSRVDEIKMEKFRPRGQSIASSVSSFSPTISPMDGFSTNAEFPFSIKRPPPIDVVDLDPSGPQRQDSLQVRNGGDANRLRGDSVSSVSTDGSGYPPLSPGSTSGSGSGGITTPAISYPVLPSSASTIDGDDFISLGPDIKNATFDVALDDYEFGVRRPQHAPLGIDVRSISSHAQAEALVLQAQKSILDMDKLGADGEGIGSGRTALSARLAAYGQSLAIERQFKEEEERKAARSPVFSENDTPTTARVRAASRPWKSSARGGSPRVKKMKRPHTSEGTETSSGNPYGSDLRPTGQTVSRSMSVHVPSHIQVDEEGGEDRETVDVGGPAPSIKIIETAATPIEPSHLAESHHHHHHSASVPLAPAAFTLLPMRSRTPDPEPDRFSIHNSSSTSLTGAPLSRVSTAPLSDTYNDLLPGTGTVKSRRDKSIASANKLARMGFTGVTTAGALLDGSPGSVKSQGHLGKRFGGLKSFVQSLKGKS